MLTKSWFWSVKLYIGRSRASESSWCPMLAGHEGVFLAAREDTSEDKMARMDVWTHERIGGWNPWIYIQWHAPKSRYNNISAEHRGPQIDCPLPPAPMRLIFSSLIIHRVHQPTNGRRLLVFGIINANNITDSSSNQQTAAAYLAI